MDEKLAKSPVVTISQGSLCGVTKTTLSGREYYSFLGIPYGKPPVGSLRFAAPQPAGPWSGVMDATVEGNPCASKHMLFRQYIGEENCLFLNVFTPKPALKGEQNVEKKAVMVWIHGGGFAMGSSEVAIYGPNYLLDGDVVLVSINYRLGPLGFLSTGDEVCSGNWGLKDQTLALKWINQNIHAFGGDPDRVTIFGESAGGASVHYHVLSPMSKGLFHRAIAQSGSALNPWAYKSKEDIKEMTTRLASNMGYQGPKTSHDLLEFLRGVEVKDLVTASEKICPLHDKLAGVTFAFVPTTEAEGPESFLPGVPIEMTKSGSFNKDIIFVTGVTTAEGFVVEFGENPMRQSPSVLQTIDKNIEVLVPPILGLERGSEKSKEAANKIKKFFFGDKPVSLETISNYYDSQTDLLFLLGVDVMVRMQALYSTLPVFYYQFSFEGIFGMGKKVIGIDLPGVCHGDELGYLFQMEILPFKVEQDSQEKKIIDKCVTMWTNIAKMGNPVSSSSGDKASNCLEGVVWDPISMAGDQLKYLDIDVTPRMIQSRGPQAERLMFWDSLFKEYGGDNNCFTLKLREKL